MFQKYQKGRKKLKKRTIYSENKKIDDHYSHNLSNLSAFFTPTLYLLFTLFYSCSHRFVRTRYNLCLKSTQFIASTLFSKETNRPPNQSKNILTRYKGIKSSAYIFSSFSATSNGCWIIVSLKIQSFIAQGHFLTRSCCLPSQRRQHSAFESSTK